jgi:hypothetical protein
MAQLREGAYLKGTKQCTIATAIKKNKSHQKARGRWIESG